MNLGNKKYRVIQVVLSVPGVIGIFLSFAGNTSPFDVIIEEWGDGGMSLHVLPTLMAIVILGWHLQRIFFTNVSNVAQTLLAWLALLAALLPLAIVAFYAFDELESIDLHEAASIAGNAICALLTVSLFISCIRKWSESTVRLESLLHSSPLPVYAYWLILVSNGFPYEWKVGTFTILLAACCYIFMIAVMWIKRPNEIVDLPSDSSRI